MMSNVIPYTRKNKSGTLEGNEGYPENGGNNMGGGMNGGNDGLEPRVARLEVSVAKIEEDVGVLKTDVHDLKIDVASIKSQLQHFATKSDLSDMKADMIKWIVGTAIGLGVASITVMTFVLNNAVPKADKVQQSPPIIINVPPSISAPAVEQVQQTTPKQTKPK